METDRSNTAKARRTPQRYGEPLDTPKPITAHCTALRRDKIQLHQPEYRHKFPQPKKNHRTLTQTHPQGQALQPRTMTLRSFFFFSSYKSHCPVPLHISAFILAFCGAVEFFSLRFLSTTTKIPFKIFFSFSPFFLNEVFCFFIVNFFSYSFYWL